MNCCCGCVLCFRRQASRTAILRVLTALMPTHVPFGFSQYNNSPAEWLTAMVDRQIGRFQASVTARAAEHRAETRWWWQRRWDKLAVNFRCAFVFAWALAYVMRSMSTCQHTSVRPGGVATRLRCSTCGQQAMCSSECCVPHCTLASRCDLPYTCWLPVLRDPS